GPGPSCLGRGRECCPGRRAVLALAFGTRRRHWGIGSGFCPPRCTRLRKGPQGGRGHGAALANGRFGRCLLTPDRSPSGSLSHGHFSPGRRTELLPAFYGGRRSIVPCFRGSALNLSEFVG